VAEETLGLEARWPELFAPLSDEQRRSIVSTLASSWHEGWVPKRADVEDLIAWERRLIDDAEYDRRTEAAAALDRARAAAG